MNARMELKRYTDAQFQGYASDEYRPLSFDRPSWIDHIPQEVSLDDPIEGRAACHTVRRALARAGAC